MPPPRPTPAPTCILRMRAHKRWCTAVLAHLQPAILDRAMWGGGGDGEGELLVEWLNTHPIRNFHPADWVEFMQQLS